MTRVLRIISPGWAGLAAALAGAALLAAGDASAQMCSGGYCSGKRELPREVGQDLLGRWSSGTRSLGDPETCNITPTIAADWADRNRQLKRLQREFREAFVSFDDVKEGVPLDLFGPPGSTDRERLRKEAKEELGNTGKILLAFARHYATRQFESCRLCDQFNAWGEIGEIALNFSGREQQSGIFSEAVSGDIFKHHPVAPTGTPQPPPDTINFKSLTLAQIEDANVREQVRALTALRGNMQRLRPDTPPNLNSSAAEVEAYQAAWDQCVKSNTPIASPAVAAPAATDGVPPTTGSTPPPDPATSTVAWGPGYDPRLCTQSMLRPILRYRRNLLVDALVAAQRARPDSPTMVSRWKAANAKTPKLECKPEDPEFPNIKWIRNLVPN